jgi:hypothetical protein
MNEPLAVTHAEIIRIATAIFNNEIELILGTRQILPHLRAVLADRNPDLTFFVGLDSETDHLPVGSERKHWNHEAILAKDRELAKYEDFYRDSAQKTLQRIIARFQELK